MTTPANKLPSTYQALQQIDAQTLLNRVKNETPYPLPEIIGPFLYNLAIESAIAMASSGFHLFMAIFKKCHWHQVRTPSPDHQNLVPLNENTWTLAQQREFIKGAPAPLSFAELNHKISSIASKMGMQNVQFYIDFPADDSLPYDRTNPSFVILHCDKFHRRSLAEIEYVIAQRLALLKIGYGFRTPFYHNLGHWGMFLINVGIITLGVRRVLSVWHAISATFIVNFACSKIDSWLLRKKIRTADQMALQTLQTNEGMVTYFRNKLCKNFSIKQGNLEAYLEFYSSGTEKGHLRLKSKLTPFGDGKYDTPKGRITDRLALALKFIPTQT